MRGALLLSFAAVCFALAAGAQAQPVAWGAATRARALRLAKYTRALRCKWVRVATWDCTDCKLPGTRLLGEWTMQKEYDDASDAFTIHHDTVEAALVITFRSTYGNSAGWLNNLDGVGVRRTVGTSSYLLHRGMSTAYYGAIRAPLFEKLQAIQAAGLAPGARSFIFTGHSRGGAIATLAAGDAVTDRALNLGLTTATTFTRVKLYTFGQPRVADKPYAQMLESRIGERFRITNSGDPTPHVPPTATAVVDANKVLSDFVRGVEAVRAGLPTWLSSLIPNLTPLAAAGYSYWHWGPQARTIMTLDYINPQGAPVRRTFALGNELRCADHDLDSVCIAEALKSVDPKCKRPSVGPFAWPGAFGAPMNRWPLFAMLDHAWVPTGPGEAGVDVGNERCFNKKPPGWWGWKMALGTSTDLFSGTDGSTRVTWRCGNHSATNGMLPLDCKLSLGDVLTGEWGNVNCFERGDVDMWSWQHHNGTARDGLAILARHRAAATACSAAGAKPVVSIEHRGLLQTWKLASVALQLGQTSGVEDKIQARFFGDCTPGTEDPLVFPLGTQTRRATLCESRPYYSWTASLATVNRLGAGTDGAVSLSWRCGAFPATRGLVDVRSRHVRRQCGIFNDCFSRGRTDKFQFTFDMGRWDPAGPVTPAQFPLPACTAPGVRPVLTVSFRGNNPADAWQLDASKLELQLSYLAPDETSLWDERTGVLLTRIETLRFRPCTNPGVVAFPRTATAVAREFTLCAVAPAQAALHPAATVAALFQHMP